MAQRDGPILAVGVLLAAGLALAGFFVGRGFERGRSGDRFVTVRGFSEREVPADLVVWPIPFTATGNDLGILQARVEEAAAKIRAFLSESFSDDEMSLAPARVTDRAAQYGGEMRAPTDRYVAEAAISVRTGKIAEVQKAMERSGHLVKQGVALIRSYERSTGYEYTQLEKIKPEMIAEATKDARRAAEQFAGDSGSRVGAIRNAQQGLFTVEDRDPLSPQIKKVRVVTTVQYLLVGD